MSSCTNHFFLTIFCASTVTFAHADTQEDQPLNLKMSGHIEAGLMHHSLTNNYGSWNGQFLRTVLQIDEKNIVNAELANSKQFGDNGTLLVLGLSHSLNKDWFANASISGSSGGFFLPRLRMDVSINRKWLEDQSLVTTIGFTAVNAKDDHKDRSVLLSAAYYFQQPWIIEGGIRFNRSNPGQVTSNAKFAAVTFNQDKLREVSLRYDFGEEAYQLIGNNQALSQFDSHALSLTWREWIMRNGGLQLRLESYKNPSYDRNGMELTWFQEF